jgi:hypothetical protein
VLTQPETSAAWATPEIHALHRTDKQPPHPLVLQRRKGVGCPYNGAPTGAVLVDNRIPQPTLFSLFLLGG